MTKVFQAAIAAHGDASSWRGTGASVASCASVVLDYIDAQVGR